MNSLDKQLIDSIAAAKKGDTVVFKRGDSELQGIVEVPCTYSLFVKVGEEIIMVSKHHIVSVTGGINNG